MFTLIFSNLVVFFYSLAVFICFLIALMYKIVIQSLILS